MADLSRAMRCYGRPVKSYEADGECGGKREDHGQGGGQPGGRNSILNVFSSGVKINLTRSTLL